MPPVRCLKSFLRRTPPRQLALLCTLLLVLSAGRAAETRSLGATNAEGAFVPNTMEIQSVSGLTQNSEGEWLFAPIPSLAPGQGFGLQGVTARIFRPSGADASTPPSMLGLAGSTKLRPRRGLRGAP